MKPIQWLTRLRFRLATFHDYGNRLNRSVDVENALMQVATGKRDLLTPDECRKLALKLGVPDCYRSEEPEPTPVCAHVLCWRCNRGKMVDVIDKLSKGDDDDLPDSMQGRLWFYNGTECDECGARGVGRYTDYRVHDTAEDPPRIKTTAYGAFTLPWRHDSYIHGAWSHVVNRVLSSDNCEVFYGPAEVCLRIVELSQGTDGDRDCAEWRRLSTYVQAKFELARPIGA
jgi:hypothetical protein